jgi:hypothetical protein
MAKDKKIAKTLIRPVHYQIALFTVLYFLLSNAIVVRLVAEQNHALSFLGLLLFGLLPTYVFLYFFSHQDFFKFFKDLEKAERKKEKSYMALFGQFGKVLACILVSIFGGPIFLALTVRLLFDEKKEMVQVAFVAAAIGTIIVFIFGKSIVGLGTYLFKLG